ncbi:MAG: hypothetical protein V1823_01655 [Chloroflexota bacterium]
MTQDLRVGEVIEASTTEFIAQCYELYRIPPLGSLVKTGDGETALYAIVCGATTRGIEPGRRPIARGRDEVSEEGVYRSSPQLLELLRSEFSALMVGNRQGGRVCHYLAPQPARIHAFVYHCSPDEVRDFSREFGFLKLLLSSRLAVPPEELAAATLRQMAGVYDDRRAFLVKAGRELAVLLGGEYGRLRSVLERIRE